MRSKKRTKKKKEIDENMSRAVSKYTRALTTYEYEYKIRPFFGISPIARFVYTRPFPMFIKMLHARFVQSFNFNRFADAWRTLQMRQYSSSTDYRVSWNGESPHGLKLHVYMNANAIREPRAKTPLLAQNVRLFDEHKEQRKFSRFHHWPCRCHRMRVYRVNSTKKIK